MADEALGNVLTDPTATFVAIDVFKTAKGDNTARAPTDDPTYVTADLGNSWAKAFQDINKWFDGTSSAGIAGNTTTLLGSFTVNQTANLGITGSAATHTMYGTALALSDVSTDTTNKAFYVAGRPYTNADGLWYPVVLSATNTANTLYIGGSGGDGATQIPFYTSTAVNTAGTLRGTMTSTGLFSWNADLTLNSASPTLTVGNGTGLSAVVVDGPNANQAQYWWSAAGNARWIAAKLATSDDWALNRYTGASVFQDAPITVQNSDGGVIVGASSGLVGFYGTTPASKPTVTGSRGGNAALADLLTELATLGLITDSSSA